MKYGQIFDGFMNRAISLWGRDTGEPTIFEPIKVACIVRLDPHWNRRALGGYASSNNSSMIFMC